MGNVAIYYRRKYYENTEISINYVENLIHKLKYFHNIKYVFIDNYGENSELYKMINYPLSHIDNVYIEKPIKDEFDGKLIQELSRNDQFRIRLFNEI